jgi:putative addiction module killer protein
LWSWLSHLFMRRGHRVIVLLCGGDKSSQSRDIAQAISIAAAWKEDS